MSVRIRLTRLGRKKVPMYRIIAVDREQKRDGRYLENLGQYNPHTEPATVVLKRPEIMKWLKDGATPSETVKSLLREDGMWAEFKNNTADKQEKASEN